MLNDWSDRMSPAEATALWQRRVDEEVARRLAKIERDLGRSQVTPSSFYEAMGHFLTLREKVFPGLPADPAWKILVTLAKTPAESDRANITAIVHGAGVAPTTALRCLSAMELEGIVERVAHPNDKRQVIIRLTAEGRRRLDSVADQWLLRLVLFAVPVLVVVYTLTAGSAWAHW